MDEKVLATARVTRKYHQWSCHKIETIPAAIGLKKRRKSLFSLWEPTDGKRDMVAKRSSKLGMVSPMSSLNTTGSTADLG
jgi:hypothetical protein